MPAYAFTESPWRDLKIHNDLDGPEPSIIIDLYILPLFLSWFNLYKPL